MRSHLSVIEGTALAATPESACDVELEAELRAILARRMRAGEPGVFSRVERLLVRTAFEVSGRNQLRAAQLLGVSRNTFRTHLARLGVIAGRRRSERAAEAETHAG